MPQEEEAARAEALGDTVQVAAIADLPDNQKPRLRQFRLVDGMHLAVGFVPPLRASIELLSEVLKPGARALKIRGRKMLSSKLRSSPRRLPTCSLL